MTFICSIACGRFLIGQILTNWGLQEDNSTVGLAVKPLMTGHSTGATEKERDKVVELVLRKNFCMIFFLGESRTSSGTRHAFIRHSSLSLASPYSMTRKVSCLLSANRALSSSI